MAGTSGIFELVAYTALHAADVFAAVDTTDSTQSPVGSTKKITAASVFAAAQPITIAAGTVTVSTPVFQATETWNASGVTFTAINLNVTDTASASGSLLANLQVGGSSKWKVDKSGNTTTTGLATFNNGATVASGNFTVSSGTSSLQAVTATQISMSGTVATTGDIRLANLAKLAWRTGGNNDNMLLYVDASNNLVWGSVGGGTLATISSAGALQCVAFGCNGATPQGKAASGGTLSGVIAALVANGILSS